MYARRILIRHVDRMDGAEFETITAKYLKKLGFDVEFTSASHDYGADLILRKRNRCVAVQCKRYQGSIGVKAVQEVIGSMAYYQADFGLVITNSSYTKNAWNLAEANGVALWDREILIKLLSGSSLSQELAELFHP